MLHEKYCLPPKPKLFEAFSGIGCQRMAFNKLGLDYEMVGVSEIDKYALQSYMAIHGETKNYGSITDIQELPPIDVFTWSFPCTDLSKAGKQAGMSGTRSGLVYEVLRILENTVDKPKVLIMENVVDLVQAKFIHEFNEIQLELEQMGYTNYVETLNAKNYGVAQNRDRVFMVSILGQYYYEFPKPIPLEKRLKDYLEDEVDEKYYLSDKMLGAFTMEGTGKYPRRERFEQNIFRNNQDVANAITTVAGSRPTDNFILIPEDTKKGYTEAHDGDGVYLNRPHQKRGVVQKGMIQTIKTSGNDVGVVVNEPVCLNSKVNGKQPSLTDRIYDSENIATCVTTSPFFMPNYTENLRIRKLTPKEVWRLMGIDDDCFHKAEKVCSNSQLFKQAGNGIVIDVFYHILKNLL